MAKWVFPRRIRLIRVLFPCRSRFQKLARIQEPSPAFPVLVVCFSPQKCLGIWNCHIYYFMPRNAKWFWPNADVVFFRCHWDSLRPYTLFWKVFIRTQNWSTLCRQKCPGNFPDLTQFFSEARLYFPLKMRNVSTHFRIAFFPRLFISFSNQNQGNKSRSPKSFFRPCIFGKNLLWWPSRISGKVAFPSCQNEVD